MGTGAHPRVVAVWRDEVHQFSNAPVDSITLVAGISGRGGRVAIVRKAGVMAVVERGGVVEPGATIVVTLPAGPHVALAPV